MVLLQNVKTVIQRFSVKRRGLNMKIMIQKMEATPQMLTSWPILMGNHVFTSVVMMVAALWGMQVLLSQAPLLVSWRRINYYYHKLSGNCFSSSFGGSCSGTPVGCRDCNEALKCRRKLKSDNTTKPGLPEYCAITPSHTMCQFKPGDVSERCGQVKTHKITEQIKQRLLDHHNELRRKVAKGEEPSQPAAANMMELVSWSVAFRFAILQKDATFPS